ncbi:hypothetical protein ACJX0J_037869, partial [Zea mays]
MIYGMFGLRDTINGTVAVVSNAIDISKPVDIINDVVFPTTALTVEQERWIYRVKFNTTIHKGKGILDYVHADLWGPSRKTSLVVANREEGKGFFHNMSDMARYFDHLHAAKYATNLLILIWNFKKHQSIHNIGVGSQYKKILWVFRVYRFRFLNFELICCQNNGREKENNTIIFCYVSTVAYPKFASNSQEITTTKIPSRTSLVMHFTIMMGANLLDDLYWIEHSCELIAVSKQHVLLFVVNITSDASYKAY